RDRGGAGDRADVDIVAGEHLDLTTVAHREDDAVAHFLDVGDGGRVVIPVRILRARHIRQFWRNAHGSVSSASTGSASGSTSSPSAGASSSGSDATSSSASSSSSGASSSSLPGDEKAKTSGLFSGVG